MALTIQYSNWLAKYKLEPAIPNSHSSFWALWINGDYKGTQIMDDFGFVVPVNPQTFFCLRPANH